MPQFTWVLAGVEEAFGGRTALLRSPHMTNPGHPGNPGSDLSNRPLQVHSGSRVSSLIVH